MKSLRFQLTSTHLLASLVLLGLLWARTENVAGRVYHMEESVDRSVQSWTAGLVTRFSDTLEKRSERLTEEALRKYRQQVDSLERQVQVEQQRIQNLAVERSRSEQGLPSYVDLDKLNEYYVSRFAQAGNTYDPVVETFETSRGSISFSKSDFSFHYVPSSTVLARLIIGKEGSTLNSELIQAWLNESAESKLRQGYKIIYSRTRNTDYGEYTEKLYRNGDAYFKSYYQYTRILETYKRHSLQYTFYVEIGSEKRKQDAMMQEYNSKLGS